MSIQQFDELNQRRKFIAEWYSVMDIPEKEKKNRVDVALDYAEIMLLLFYMITEQEYEKDECVDFLRERLIVIAERELEFEGYAYINDWVDKTAKRIVEETYDKYENEIEDVLEEEETEKPKEQAPKESKPEKIINFKEYGVEIPESKYWTSPFRATLLGIEIASTVVNYKELVDAINEGKTRKTWITEGDDRVRPTHDAVHGVEIPINELFTVGDSYMLMPGDTVNGASLNEIAGCRCHLVCH